MAATVTIARDQLAYVLLNLGLAAAGRADEVFAGLRAWPTPTPGAGYPPPATPAPCSA
jgi:hypothetical protein